MDKKITYTYTKSEEGKIEIKENTGKYAWPLCMQFVTLGFLPLIIATAVIAVTLGDDCGVIGDIIAANAVMGVFLGFFCAIPFGIIGLVCTMTRLKQRFRYQTATEVLSILNLVTGVMDIAIFLYMGSHM